MAGRKPFATSEKANSSGRPAENSVSLDLRHRGEAFVVYQDAGFWTSVGGDAGVRALITDLYRRIEQDELLRVVFPHFNSEQAIPFFLKWFGGDLGYSDDLSGGLLRMHQPRYISAKSAAAWLRCMRESVVACGLDTQLIMPQLTRIAKAMIHSPETDTKLLYRSCDGVQDPVQNQFESLLDHVAKGCIEPVRDALVADKSLAFRRGTQNRTLVWTAAYHNRAKILDLLLQTGADCNSPACDPLHATMACDIVHVGTGIAVTPLAIARKWHRALVEPLVKHGAIDDIFTAAWLGDLPAVRDYITRNPDLVNAVDPVDDFQEVTVLCHAVCGGDIETGKFLIDHGAEVEKHSGKLLTLAVVMNRLDLVQLLIDHKADVRRVDLLGRLDDADRPIADLLIANGKTVPDWMLPRACRPDVSTNELHRVSVLLDYGASPDDRGWYGLTALHYAVRGGTIPLIQLLLDRGADVNALDVSGLTPLLHLTRTRSKADPIPVMELLAAGGADLNARDQMNATLLMHFARKGQLEPVRWLLKHGADRELKNKSGKSAIQLARAHPAVVRLLETC